MFSCSYCIQISRAVWTGAPMELPQTTRVPFLKIRGRKSLFFPVQSKVGCPRSPSASQPPWATSQDELNSSLFCCFDLSTLNASVSKPERTSPCFPSSSGDPPCVWSVTLSSSPYPTDSLTPERCCCSLFSSGDADVNAAPLQPPHQPFATLMG